MHIFSAFANHIEVSIFASLKIIASQVIIYCRLSFTDLKIITLCHLTIVDWMLCLVTVANIT